MDRKILAIGIGILVVVSGVLVFLIMPAPAATNYHYERNLSAYDPKDTYLRIEEIVDCELEITFVSDPDLLYSVDIEFYEPMRHWDDFTWLDAHTPPDNDMNYIGVNHAALINGRILVPPDVNDVPVKSIELTLGTGTNYTMRIEGKNLTVSVMYDNGVILKGGDLAIQELGNGVGSVLLLMDSDIYATGCDHPIDIWGTETIVVDIRNPTYLGGKIDVRTENLGGVQLLGWTQAGISGHYQFLRTATEEMLIDLSAETIYVSLLTQS